MFDPRGGYMQQIAAMQTEDRIRRAAEYRQAKQAQAARRTPKPTRRRNAPAAILRIARRPT
jgi:cytochrome c553